MESEDGFFSTDSTKLRNIILGDLSQEPPKGNLTCTAAKKQKLSSGSYMYILTLESENGEVVVLNCFERDIKTCIAEWGIGNPVVAWDSVHFQKNFLGTRYMLAPSTLEPKEEDV
jgi:hypothetical protein